MERRKKKFSEVISMVIAQIRAWWKDYQNWRRVRNIERVKELAKRRSREEVQRMEYRGRMYSSYRGIPIVRASEDDLGCPWEYVLKSSRAVYQDWLIERELEKRNIENRLLDK